jgi:predicted NAD/FAD-binding protein
MNLAIVGSGIAGLGAAYELRRYYADTKRLQISMFEQNSYVGGHSNTAVIKHQTGTSRVDTGFMVFNKVTYPNLTRLFEELRVPVSKTDMSFSLQHVNSGLEYSGASFGRLFGQKRNLISPRFWRMLWQLNRFNNEAQLNLSNPSFDETTLEEYVQSQGYGKDLLQLYLIPISGAIWSGTKENMSRFPIKTLLRFFYNHGFLGMTSQHQWWTVDGGSCRYVERLVEFIKPQIELNLRVTAITKRSNSVELITNQGALHFDQVIVATHADQALRILSEPTPIETKLLSKFQYQSNDVLLHTDASVMPNSKACWSSWNYRIGKQNDASVHYWMNSLQNVSNTKNIFVSLNSENLVHQEHVLNRFKYDHPIFSIEAVAAQKQLLQLNHQSSNQRVFFCGSYFRYGFHEDALLSGYEAAKAVCKGVVAV